MKNNVSSRGRLSVRPDHRQSLPTLKVERSSSEPHYRIYNMNRELLSKGTMLELSDGCDQISDLTELGVPIASLNLLQFIWEIEGVELVEMYPHRIEISKASAYHWNSIHLKVVNAITTTIYGCDRKHLRVSSIPLR